MRSTLPLVPLTKGALPNSDPWSRESQHHKLWMPTMGMMGCGRVEVWKCGVWGVGCGVWGVGRGWGGWDEGGYLALEELRSARAIGQPSHWECTSSPVRAKEGFGWQVDP